MASLSGLTKQDYLTLRADEDSRCDQARRPAALGVAWDRLSRRSARALRRGGIRCRGEDH